MASTEVSNRGSVYSELPPGQYIRLLRLHPRNMYGNKLRASLTAFPLSAAKRYTAVSYAWGETCNTKSILINDLDFQVGDNIWHFLSVAQLSTDYLWIDAICINQADGEEKNHQVEHMGEIYETAATVAIWLGCEDPGTEFLFRFMELASIAWNDGRKGPIDTFKAVIATARLQISSSTKDKITALAIALNSLFERNYWQRTWVVQECLLATEGSLFVCCGRQMVRWNAFKDFSRCCHPVIEEWTRSPYGQSAVQTWTTFLNLFNQWGLGRGFFPGRVLIGWADWYEELFALLEHIRNTSCSILHDKIFGIMRLVQHNPKHEEIHVDYAMSIDELFLRSLACWTMGRITVKLAHALMLNLNLDLVKICEDIQKHKLLHNSIGMPVYARIPPVEFLAIRLGTVVGIQKVSVNIASVERYPAILIRFDGPYSDRLDVVEAHWPSARPNFAVGFSLCTMEVGDVIFAFYDSMASLVFRTSGPKLVRIGCAVLANASDTSGLGDMKAPVEVTNILENGLIRDFLQPNNFRSFEIDGGFDEFGLEINPSAAVGVLLCHSAGHSWPPPRSVESQRHLRPRF